MSIVAIIIQARSTSTRFPNKILENVGTRPMLKCVIDNCKASAEYINKINMNKRATALVAMVVPLNDPIIKRWTNCVPIFAGSEQDVLSRYVQAQKELRADYVCRVTSDCPMLPPYIISKHITLAVMNEYDYVSNVDPRFRTSPDRWDCEVISSRMLDWLGQNAQTPEEKEHVTLKARTDPPPWIRHGVTIGFYDLADIKISVDTTDDLEKVRNEWAKVRTKVDTALEYFGEYNVHRF